MRVTMKTVENVMWRRGGRDVTLKFISIRTNALVPEYVL